MQILDELTIQAHMAIENEAFEGTYHLFEDIAEKCLEIRDYSFTNEFYNKCEKLKQISVQQ